MYESPVRETKPPHFSPSFFSFLFSFSPSVCSCETRLCVCAFFVLFLFQASGEDDAKARMDETVERKRWMELGVCEDETNIARRIKIKSKRPVLARDEERRVKRGLRQFHG